MDQSSRGLETSIPCCLFLMSDSYDRIEAAASLLLQVSNILKPIDASISDEYLKQSKEFLELIPDLELDYSEEDKEYFKQRLLN